MGEDAPGLTRVTAPIAFSEGVGIFLHTEAPVPTAPTQQGASVLSLLDCTSDSGRQLLTL